MRIIPIPTLVLALALPAAALAPNEAFAAGPVAKSIGMFGDWQAATYVDAGQTVCYAFTRTLEGGKPSKGPGGAVLSIAERPTIRDAVAIAVDHTFPSGAVVSVSIDRTKQDFYTSGSSAFSRDGAGLVGAMERGSDLVAVSPGAGNRTTTDRFSLKGFTAAHTAIVKACPAR
ncbi:MAG: hypothetical protein KGK10_03100 [Rhodospirillales bacterium]|nr:hypothetical protein [Rhodospirillales bacterium]